MCILCAYKDFMFVVTFCVLLHYFYALNGVLRVERNAIRALN